ncbi:MAG: hypothetical protein DHS20C15_34620 [Planctomycetota bacterium]|nr:MAG: hypothetical protein DHS20C15_34620 [Planctomycetota bacterium]
MATSSAALKDFVTCVIIRVNSAIRARCPGPAMTREIPPCSAAQILAEIRELGEFSWIFAHAADPARGAGAPLCVA